MKQFHKILIVIFLFLLKFLLFPVYGVAEYGDGYYPVAAVIDGDTFELIDGKEVRLIGIDAPEMWESCWQQSLQHLTTFIGGKTVYMEKDVSDTDENNRLLRYVYVKDIFVNYQMVFDGYAVAVDSLPDDKYEMQLLSAENNARSNNRGCFWDDSSRWYVRGECFIATAVFGDDMAEEVKIMKEFRDRILLESSVGRKFVEWYYKTSPPLARFIANHHLARTFVRWGLLPVIALAAVTLRASVATVLVCVVFTVLSGIVFYLYHRKRWLCFKLKNR